MIIELNKRYVRVSPTGDESIAVIKTEQEVAYHQDLAEKGFKYTEVKESAPPANVCISCEG